jgi:hypothetical protein
MTDMSNIPIEPEKPEPFYQIWIKALTRPADQTYYEIASSPTGNPNIAYLWLFLTGLISSIVSFGVQGASLRQIRDFLPPEAASVLGSNQSIGTGLIGAICGAPIAAAFSVFGFAISVALIQWIAKMFGGNGDYSKMVYTLACIAAPINLVSAVLGLFSAIPLVGIVFGLVSFLVGIYSLFLYVSAVKGVNQFGWGPAIGAVLIPGAVIFLFCACCLILSLVLMGPAIGEVFSGITNSLGVY